MLTIITIIHGCFLRTGILIQNVLGWIKVGLIVFMVLTGLFVVLVRPETSASSNGELPHMASWDSLWEGTIWNWGVLSTALFKVFYSYAGLENVNNVLNEVKNPVRTLKSAATAALATACILYLLVNCAYFLVVPLDEITQSGELIAALFFERTFGPTVGRTVLPLAVAVSAVGNVMVVTFALVRQVLRTARGNKLISSLGTTKPRNRPSRVSTIFSLSVLVQTVWCALGRINHPLYSFHLGHCSSALERSVLLHPGSGGIPCTVLRTRPVGRLSMATIYSF